MSFQKWHGAQTVSLLEKVVAQHHMDPGVDL